MRYEVWYGVVESDKDGSRVVEKRIKFDIKNKKLPFNLKEVALKDVFKDEKEYYSTLRKEAIKFFKNKAEKELKREDLYVIHLLKLLDELDEIINLLENKVEDIEEVRESEICDLTREEIKALRVLRSKVENEIEKILEKIAPNLYSILGIVAARLLEKAGSLKKLAELPASTIQVLGAEKSLYKAMARVKRGKKAKFPKHGVIFQHPFIRTLPKKKRGKMSRYMAAKVAIAARIDYFSGELREELSQSVRKKYEELRRN